MSWAAVVKRGRFMVEVEDGTSAGVHAAIFALGGGVCEGDHMAADDAEWSAAFDTLDAFAALVVLAAVLAMLVVVWERTQDDF